MSIDKTYISPGDFIDLFYKIRQKGLNVLYSKLHFKHQSRTRSKWNTAESSSDFWIIPRIRERWNEKCTGNPDQSYEDYLVSNYLSDAENLRMLSVGSGTGAKERKFAKHPNFARIDGIDMAEKQIEKARRHASELKMHNIKYITGDFLKHDFPPDTYDLVLFNSSLHHFKDISSLLQNKVKPLLKKDGWLIIFEYVGPNRLQWKREQLELSNKLLKGLPEKYKLRLQSKSVKRHIYRPGMLRMLFVDPSEAVDSEAILPSVHKHFKTVEEKKLGWDITHLLLKDIAHNFLDDDKETRSLLKYIFDEEDKYLSKTGRSDAVFGIYKK
ncbi:MAG: class I SAM-dependent methyltransferase [Bacteroidales bacterium]